MPFSLHPSGYCAYFSEYYSDNLVTGRPCPLCGRIAGHSRSCPSWKYDETKGKTSRPKLFDCTSVLWARSPQKNFITFTLPSLAGGIYQRDPDCPETGDLIITGKFSKVLEAYALRSKRAGDKLSYAWVSEAQTKRSLKFGGSGDIHYHLIVNKQLKDDRGKVTDKNTLFWLQNLWCEHVGVHAKNCVHVDPLPDYINSTPAYLSKYLGKGTQRMILSRRFNASRDLTKFKPVTLSNLPDCELMGSYDYTTPTGYEMTVRYYNTREVLECYGSAMLAESELDGTRTDKNFTTAAIIERAITRQRAFAGSSNPT